MVDNNIERKIIKIIKANFFVKNNYYSDKYIELVKLSNNKSVGKVDGQYFVTNKNDITLIDLDVQYYWDEKMVFPKNSIKVCIPTIRVRQLNSTFKVDKDFKIVEKVINKEIESKLVWVTDIKERKLEIDNAAVTRIKEEMLEVFPVFNEIDQAIALKNNSKKSVNESIKR